MASSLDFVTYVCDQISDAGEITYKKMFGEYTIYCNEKPIGVVCNNQFFIKKTKAGIDIYPECEQAAPYNGAKAHFLIEHIDDRSFITKFILATYQELPLPKKKKNTSSKEV